MLAAGVAVADGLPRNWPMGPAEIHRRLAYDDFTITKVESAGAGVTGASKLTLRFGDDHELVVKWKAVPPGSLDSWNNSPRKELAAYAVQRWLFAPEDYVVPTPVPRCIALDRYAAVDPKATPSLPGTRCVLGVAVVWMRDVMAPDSVYDPARFASDPHYAAHMGDFNLLTYLIEHRDGRKGNFLLATDPEDPRVFAVDNGIAFDPFPWNFFVQNWHVIRVPWLRRDPVDRLRKVGHGGAEKLGVLVELDTDAGGMLRLEPLAKRGPNLDPKDGVRIAGGRVQFGLTKDEIEDVEERIEELLDDVDDGKIQVR